MVFDVAGVQCAEMPKRLKVYYTRVVSDTDSGKTVRRYKKYSIGAGIGT